MSPSASPLISVILASYNHVEFVLRSLRSVLEQDMGPMEVIVVDDGSSDGTLEVVRGCRDPRVRVIPLAENRRQHPRNLALGAATGRYVAFQNSDDEWAPGKLAAQVEILDDPDVVACFTAVEIIGPDGAPLEGTWANGPFTTENRTSAAWLGRFFDHGNCLCISSALARRASVEEVGRFRAHLIQLGDLDLWVRLAATGGFHVVGRPLTRMRVVPGRNVSRPFPAQSRRSTIEFAEVLARYAEAPVRGRIPEVFPGLIPSGAGSPVGYLAGLAIRCRDFSPAHRLFADRVLAAILDDPEDREELARTFGSRVIQEFIEKRGEIQFGIVKGEE